MCKNLKGEKMSIARNFRLSKLGYYKKEIYKYGFRKSGGL